MLRKSVVSVGIAGALLALAGTTAFARDSYTVDTPTYTYVAPDGTTTTYSRSTTYTYPSGPDVYVAPQVVAPQVVAPTVVYVHHHHWWNFRDDD